MLELLGWDSELFGFRVARAHAQALDEESAEAIEEWCDRNRVRCLYLLADSEDDETRRLVKARGYREVDVRVTLRHGLDDVPEADASHEIREAREDDIPALRRLAAGSHLDSRFYQDPGFPREACDELYATWIEGGIRDPGRLVLVPEIDGVPGGYNLVEPGVPGGVARLELLAVAEANRGNGVARALIGKGLRRGRAAGAAAMEVVTQAGNIPSLTAYLRTGFRIRRRQRWLHRWFD